MVTFYEIDGFDEFVKFLDCLKTKSEPIFVFFAGSEGPDGKSWCSDCAAAHPVVYATMETSAPKNAHVLHVQVGDRETQVPVVNLLSEARTWKDRRCIFRTSRLTRLISLPTVQRWETPFILREDECKSASLIEMLIAEEP